MPYEYTVLETAASYRWTFVQILPLLPVPGTAPFLALCRELQPYGLAPTDIVVESASQRLSDIAVVVFLFNQKVTLRFTYGWMELSVNRLIQGDEPLLLDIAEKMFGAIRTVEQADPSGHLSVGLRSHIQLAQLEVDRFLRHHLKASEAADLSPEAMVYKKTPHGDDLRELRVVLARSVPYIDALYIDTALDYTPTVGLKQAAERLDADYDQMLSALGLVERNLSKEAET